MEKCRPFPTPSTPGTPEVRADLAPRQPASRAEARGHRRGGLISAQGGYSFLELLVCLFLLGLLLTLVVPTSYRWICRQRVGVTAAGIAGQLERARTQSVFERQSYGVVFDEDEGTYQMVQVPDADEDTDMDELAVADSRKSLSKGIAFVHPEGGDPVRFREEGEGYGCAVFDLEGYLVPASPPFDPHAVYIGNRYGDFRRVRVSYGGCVRVEVWDESKGWQ